MKSYFEKVLKDKEPLFITRNGREDMVVLSKSEYSSLMETFHLLRSPKNAERLLKAIDQDQQNGGKVKTLLD